MEIFSIVVGVLAVLSVLGLVRVLRVGDRIKREQSDRLKTGSIPVTAVVIAREDLGYIVRSGSEDLDDPHGYKVTLQLEIESKAEVSRVLDIRPSELERWELGSTHAVRVVPEAPELWDFETAFEDEQPVEGMNVILGSPLWLVGMEGPHEWFLGPQRGPQVFVFDVFDPHRDDDDSRDELVDIISLVVSEEIALMTESETQTVTYYDDTNRKILHASVTLENAEEIVDTQAEDVADEDVLIWFYASSKESLEMACVMRSALEYETFETNVFSASDDVRARLSKFGVTERPAPRWYHPIEPSNLHRYCVVTDALMCAILYDGALVADVPEFKLEVFEHLRDQESDGRWRFVEMALGRLMLEESEHADFFRSIEDDMTQRFAPLFGVECDDPDPAWRSWRGKIVEEKTW